MAGKCSVTSAMLGTTVQFTRKCRQPSSPFFIVILFHNMIPDMIYRIKLFIALFKIQYLN